jgi:hypothetical protein
MKVIRNFLPPSDSSPYNPAKSVQVAPGEHGEIRMNGMGGESFGVRRILPYSQDMNKIMVSARLNEDTYLFRGVQLAVVYELFRSISGLYAPFIIQKNNSIVFELENTDSSGQLVNIQLVGYDQYAMGKLKRAYQQIGAQMPVPRFLYGHASVAAGQVNADLGVKSKSVDVEVRRMAMSSDRPENITASMKVYNTSIRNELFIQQLNDEFDGQYANVPFIVGANVPFDVFASNANSQPAEVSFLCESYVGQDASSKPLTEEA